MSCTKMSIYISTGCLANPENFENPENPKNAFMIYELVVVYLPWGVARFLESRMGVEASLPFTSFTY